MRSDEKLDAEKRRADRWSPGRGSDLDLFDSELPLGMSLSGHERDHLFLNLGGRQFLEVSGICGLDSVADGRTFVYCDYDRDGYHDIAISNNNRPQLELFHNELGRMSPERGERSRNVAVRLVGGNNTPNASTEFSPRDGVGSRMNIEAGPLRLVRELHCGEGRAGQNSRTMLVGIGTEENVDRLQVRWTSGRTSELSNIPAGSLVTVFERPEDGPDANGFHIEQYRRGELATLPSTSADEGGSQLAWAGAIEGETPSDLRMFTTMATWCAACKRHIPVLQQIRQSFDGAELGMFGVPIDETDSPAMLAAYEERFQPGFEVLTKLSASQVEDVRQTLRTAINTDALPCTVVTDTEGRVLLAVPGVPNVSQLRKLLGETRQNRVAHDPPRSRE